MTRQPQEAFLEGHMLAFEQFGAVTGRGRDDNLKPAVVRGELRWRGADRPARAAGPGGGAEEGLGPRPGPRVPSLTGLRFQKGFTSCQSD